MLKQIAGNGPAGNRWFKVNLHVHGQGSMPAELVAAARAAEIDILAITDHQTFKYYDAIATEAQMPGRELTVLPGMEITTHEGVHILAVFPTSQSRDDRLGFVGWLEIPGSGDTKRASKRTLQRIAEEVIAKGGTVVVPHPKSPGIGLLGSASKIGTKVDWLESGLIRLMQCKEDLVSYIARDDDGNFVNRFVLASASPKDVAESSYCLAPLNKSDFDASARDADIGAGCSWFRMAEPSVEGLKQVACEPRTRISRTEPSRSDHDCVLGVSVSGGYADGEAFLFNEALNCVVGANYAGKSAVLDFVRFATGHDLKVQDPSRFLNRLNDILQPGGTVDLFVRHAGALYAVRRTFDPRMAGQGPSYRVEECRGTPNAYRYDSSSECLEPDDDFQFPLEVYEQGQIGRLHDDVDRQLEMLDDFAGVGDLKRKRQETCEELNVSATVLAPLYEERERLAAAVAQLKELQDELAGKEALLPDEEADKKWGAAEAVVSDLESVVTELQEGAGEVRAAGLFGGQGEESTAVELLFGQSVPDPVDKDAVVEAELLARWRASVQTSLAAISKAQEALLTAVDELGATSKTHRAEWVKKKKARDQELAKRLAQAGVESPTELIARVGELRATIRKTNDKHKPRLVEVTSSIQKQALARQRLLAKLRTTNAAITTKRQEKAKELTDQLDGQVEILLEAAADDRGYCELLERLTAGQHAHKDQFPRVTRRLSPIDLGEALRNGGTIGSGLGAGRSVAEFCGVTEHTQKSLGSIANDIANLNDLETTLVDDVPTIRVKRRGEDVHADLRNLSPGEQSAAILMLALQTRGMPLILDQPEDELGYEFVVHLLVPSVLRAKFTRQLLVVTHNPNVAVLGDADHIIQMENRPQPKGGRHCGPKVAGSFESDEVTQALLGIEGGRRAFQHRLHRYSLPKASRPDVKNLLASVVEKARVDETPPKASAEPKVTAEDLPF